MKGILENTSGSVLKPRYELHGAWLGRVVPGPSRGRGTWGETGRCSIEVYPQSLHARSEVWISLHSREKSFVSLLEVRGTRESGVRRGAKPSFKRDAVKLAAGLPNLSRYFSNLRRCPDCAYPCTQASCSEWYYRRQRCGRIHGQITIVSPGHIDHDVRHIEDFANLGKNRAGYAECSLCPVPETAGCRIADALEPGPL